MTDPASTPAAAVHRQVEAYNDGDTDAFAACYDERAVVASLDDGDVLAEGRDEIHDRYDELFEAAPDLHCELVEEFTVGNYVACKERVTGADEPLDALAVYLVTEGAIQRLWLGEDG